MSGLLRLQRDLVLPLLRIVLLGWLLATRFIGASEGLRASLRKHPLELLHAPHLERTLGQLGWWPPPGGLVAAVGPALLICGICALIGLATRPALLLTGLAFIVINAVGSGWGFFNHTPALPGQLLLALALLPGSTGFSLDRCLLLAWRRRRGDSTPWLEIVCPPVPRFGEIFVGAVVGAFYTASGLAKVRADLLPWLSGSTLQWYLAGGARSLQYWYGPLDSDTISGHLYMGQVSPLGKWLASSSAMMAVLSWVTLATELFAPVFLILGRWWRVGFVVVAFGFHVVVRLTLGPAFTDWIIVDVVLVVPFLVSVFRRGQRSAVPVVESDAAISEIRARL